MIKKYIKAYSGKKETVVIEVVLEKVTLWQYDNGQPYREFLDFESKRASKEIYEIMNNNIGFGE